MNYDSTTETLLGPWLRGLTIIEVEPLPVYSQARTHKRRRVNKKWLKRYGVKQTGWNYFLNNNVVIGESSGALFCHAQVAARLRRELAEPSGSTETNANHQ